MGFGVKRIRRPETLSLVWIFSRSRPLWKHYFVQGPCIFGRMWKLLLWRLIFFAKLWRHTQRSKLKFSCIWYLLFGPRCLWDGDRLSLRSTCLWWKAAGGSSGQHQWVFEGVARIKTVRKMNLRLLFKSLSLKHFCHLTQQSLPAIQILRQSSAAHFLRVWRTFQPQNLI